MPMCFDLRHFILFYLMIPWPLPFSVWCMRNAFLMTVNGVFTVPLPSPPTWTLCGSRVFFGGALAKFPFPSLTWHIFWCWPLVFGAQCKWFRGLLGFIGGMGMGLEARQTNFGNVFIWSGWFIRIFYIYGRIKYTNWRANNVFRGLVLSLKGLKFTKENMQNEKL